jgi:hypothetical protein
MLFVTERRRLLRVPSGDIEQVFDRYRSIEFLLEAPRHEV